MSWMASICLRHREQFGLLPECRHQRGPSAHPTQGSTGGGTQLPQLAGAKVRQLMLLEVVPDMFHRIELRRIAGQPLQGEPTALGGDEVSHREAAMSWQTVPDHQQGPTQVPHQVLQKLDDLRR
jgi:hypothetical protein